MAYGQAYQRRRYTRHAQGFPRRGGAMSTSADDNEREHQETELNNESKRRSPRPRWIPKTRAAQTKADAVAELFQPVPIVIDQDVADTPFEARLAAWFERHDWQPFPFQREVWTEILGGASGLLHATTGAGKTWAVWLGALAAYTPEHTTRTLPAPLTVLW